jgi:hypothetical protein
LKIYFPELKDEEPNIFVNRLFSMEDENYNPFISPYLEEISGVAEPKFLQSNIKLDKIASSVGGLDVTTMAIGMTDFLIERTKEELTIAFFHRFKDFLTKYPESEALFPKTSDFIVNMLAHEYSLWLPTLQNKFLEDIQNIPFRIDDVLELPKYKYIIDELPELLICLKIIETIQDASKDVKNAKHSAEIIHDIAEIEAWSKIKNPDSKNLHASFQTMDLISQS